MSASQVTDAIRGSRAPVEIVPVLWSNSVCPRCIGRLFGVTRKALYGLTVAEWNEGVAAVLPEGVDRTVLSAPCCLCLGVLQDTAASDGKPPPQMRGKRRAFSQPQANYDFSNSFGPRILSGRGGTGAGAGAGAGVRVGATAATMSSSTCLPSVSGEVIHRIREAGFRDVEDFTPCINLPAATALREFSLISWLIRTRDDLTKWPCDVVSVRDFVRSGLSADISTELRIPSTSMNHADLRITINLFHRAALEEVFAFVAENTPKFRKRNGLPNMDKFIARFPGGFPESTHMKCPPDSPPVAAAIHVDFVRRTVFFRGRYIKLSRGLSQTPWFVDKKRIGEDSVEELIGIPIGKALRCSDLKFHSAGREDIDVRMLGEGRPFVLELMNCRTVASPADYEALTKAINDATDKVEVRDLELTDKDFFQALQNGADSKRKTYACVVWVQRAIKPSDLDVLRAAKDVTVAQLTPLRVLHRRSLLTRNKVIHSMDPEYINAHYFILRLTTSAGTYVKEFVHGDFGRTLPNVGTLLDTEAQILQLDVLDLVYDTAQDWKSKHRPAADADVDSDCD